MHGVPPLLGWPQQARRSRCRLGRYNAGVTSTCVTDGARRPLFLLISESQIDAPDAQSTRDRPTEALIMIIG
jgi:hypothetical protein